MTEPLENKNDSGGRYRRATASRPTPRRTRHGMKAVKAKVMVRGLQDLDTRTSAARALVRWRRELVSDLGGPQAVSAAQMAHVDLAVRTRLYVESLDAYLMEQESVVIKRRKAVMPILLERTRLADSLSRYLLALGLERRAAPVPTLAEYLTGDQRSDPEASASHTPALCPEKQRGEDGETRRGEP